MQKPGTHLIPGFLCLYQLQIFQSVSDSIMEHILCNMISQSFYFLRTISHGNLHCCIFKHGEIIITVSKHDRILPRNIKESAHRRDPHCLVKAFGDKFNGGSRRHYAYVANVGDSRLYVIGEKIQQITRDHSLVQEMVRMGELDPEQARKHPKKNIITRALGAEKTVDIDFFDLKLEPGDVVLMCSDGLSNMVEDSQLREIISDTSTDLDEKGRILIREANRNGGKDNIAIVLVEPFADEVKAC